MSKLELKSEIILYILQRINSMVALCILFHHIFHFIDINTKS